VLLSGHDVTVAARPDLDDLIRAHHLRLVRLAYVFCGDASEAEDIVADAYARAWPRLAAGGVDEPLAYLRRAVLNTASSWRRHRSVVRREEARRRADPGTADVTASVGERDELLEAVRRLPAAQVQVIVLRYLEDLSEAETARQLGLPIGTVKSRAARGLDALRRQLEDQADG
jgi:RNA polymerase sigma-70 factor (sigma-E family)